MKWLKIFVQGKIDQYRDWQDPDREENPMACPEIELDVTPDLYGKLLSEATAAGAAFNGTQASIHGLTFDWNYDTEAQKLHVTCIKKPFYASCGMVETSIRDLVEKSKEAV